MTKSGVTETFDAWFFKDNRCLRQGGVEVLVETPASLQEYYAETGSITAPVLVNRQLIYVSFNVSLYELD